MLKTIAFFGIVFVGLLASLRGASESSPGAQGGPEAVTQVLAAAGFSVPSPSSIPSTFVYGGQSSASLLPGWPREDKVPLVERDRTTYETTWREPGGGLVATWRATAFAQWPAVEFRWTFRNESSVPAKSLTRVEALDLSIASHQSGFELVHSTGGLAGDKMDSDQLGFALSETPLGSATLSAAGGRSSNKDLPFFVVHGTRPDAGIFVGIGWSGQWQAAIDASKPSSVHLTAEMPGMDLALPPHEEIISPSILLGSYRGPWTTGSNVLRTILYAKYTPLLDGRKPLPPVSWNSWFLFDNRISLQAMEAQADGAAKAGVDYFCIDSGWFDGGFPTGVGNWTVDAAKFPYGLQEVSRHVTALGMELGLWFEPERALPGTRLAREHPDWVHGDLVDFGNPAARDWLFNMMTSFIDRAHIRWICWDFNTDPLADWNNADAPGQKGLAQIRHIMGLYAFLDRLMETHPGLLVQGCASGGRRIDLETIRRSHTIWKSDYTADVGFLQFHETGGDTFLPGQILDAHIAPDSVPYDTDSILGGPFGLRGDMPKLSPQLLDGLQKGISLARRLRSLINENFYALFPQKRDPSFWTGWQFDSPSQKKGFVVLLRSQACPVDSAAVALHGLDAAATYRIETVRGPSASSEMTGAEMMQGWSVALAPHSSAVYVYSRVK